MPALMNGSSRHQSKVGRTAAMGAQSRQATLGPIADRLIVSVVLGKADIRGHQTHSCFRPKAAVQPVVRCRGAEAESGRPTRRGGFIFLDGRYAERSVLLVW